jgi:HEAT repeat protein
VSAGSVEAVEVLRKLPKDADPKVRLTAASRLLALGETAHANTVGESKLDAVAELLRNQTNVGVKR